MSEYNEYVTAINKIYDYLAQMKAGWNNLDNHNYIESIEEYRQEVLDSSTLIKNSSSTSPKKDKMEVLGND